MDSRGGAVNDEPAPKNHFLDDWSGGDRVQREEPRHSRLLRGETEPVFADRFRGQQYERTGSGDDYRLAGRLGRAGQGVRVWPLISPGSKVIAPEIADVETSRDQQNEKQGMVHPWTIESSFKNFHLAFSQP
jgi:hypothetical protein